jgi:hypothetical protein
LSPEQHADDRTLLALFEALEQGADPGDLGRSLPAGEAGETLARLYIETLGLLPYALDPLAPSPAVRDRVLAIATGDDTQEVDRSALPPLPLAAVPAPAAAAAPAAPRPARAATAAVAPAMPLPRPSRPARRWPLALAAALILALLGLSGWLYRELAEKSEVLAADQTTIGRLADDLKAERARAAENATLRAELERVRSRFGEMQQQLSLVTAPSVEMSPLRPTGQLAAAREAHGRLYVAADHQHWYMSVYDLAPSGAGREYQLWFIGDAGPVSGGTFTGAPGEPMHLSSEHMPAGTRAILITLEPAPGAPAPSGPEVMRAAPPIKVI